MKVSVERVSSLNRRKLGDVVATHLEDDGPAIAITPQLAQTGGVGHVAKDERAVVLPIRGDVVDMNVFDPGGKAVRGNG